MDKEEKIGLAKQIFIKTDEIKEIIKKIHDEYISSRVGHSVKEIALVVSDYLNVLYNT